MNLSEHLTGAELREYVAGSAPPPTLLSWDDHFASCPECRARLGPKEALAHWAGGLAVGYEEAGEPHLSYEQLVARAEKRVGAGEEFAVTAHLKRCGACSEELADLVRFRGEVRGQGSRRKRLPYLWLAASAILVAAVAVPLTMRRAPAVPAVSAPVAAAVSIPANWPAEDRALVEQTLRAGRLSFGAAPADVLAKTGTLLGTAGPALFAPLSPVSTVVEDDRPEFRWQKLAGATSYRVEVYDSDFRLAAKSPELAGDDWAPPHSLDRSKIYHWQVVASRRGESITAPAPPAPDAEFRILDAASEQHIERARQDGPMGHLLAAALLAREGLEPEAMKELDQLPAETRKQIR